jgi:hypothetical protein
MVYFKERTSIFGMLHDVCAAPLNLVILNGIQDYETP